MLPLSTIIVLLLGHWVAYFIFQTDKMLKDIYLSALSRFPNYLLYTLVFSMFSYFVIPNGIIVWFTILVFITHSVINTYSNKALYYIVHNSNYTVDTIPNLNAYTISAFSHFLYVLSIFSIYVFLLEY